MNGQNLEAIEKESEMAHQQYHFFRACILAALHECFTSLSLNHAVYTVATLGKKKKMPLQPLNNTDYCFWNPYAIKGIYTAI